MPMHIKSWYIQTNWVTSRTYFWSINTHFEEHQSTQTKGKKKPRTHSPSSWSILDCANLNQMKQPSISNFWTFDVQPIIINLKYL